MDFNSSESNEQLAPKARLSAMNLLARREYSRGELRIRLVRKYPSALVETVLDRLVEEKLQSDERFTGSFVRVWQQKGYGPMRIRQELRAREVDETLVEAYLDIDGEQWQEGAFRMLQKKFGSENTGDRLLELKKMKYLQQRGFSYQDIRNAMKYAEEYSE